ncbi:hypothetical protein JHK85_021209 [Glycine max]|nr:hypothetical protein JHK85_021209 [Glycine max]
MGELLEALKVFREMVTGDSAVWNSIIAAFAQHSDGDEALHLYKSMRRVGFPADHSTLTSVLRSGSESVPEQSAAFEGNAQSS